MKTHPTIAGNAYVVFSKTGCTVTDSTGTLNKEVPAGDWLSIPAAPSDALILTDDNAIVRNANFKLALAPSSVGSGGGTSEGGGEPEGDYLLFNADRSVRGGRLNTLKDGNYL